MASELKTNALTTSTGNTITVATGKIFTLAAGADFATAGTNNLDFSGSDNVVFPADSITGDAISGGNANCTIGVGATARVTANGTGAAVNGELTATSVDATTIKAGSKDIKSYDLMAWGCFKVSVAVDGAGAVTLTVFGEQVLGSSSNFNLGSSGVSGAVMTLYYTSPAAAGDWDDGDKAMVVLGFNGTPGLAKLLDYTIVKHNDRLVITFPTQSGIGTFGATVLEGSIQVMLPIA
jgi:hypothetical protein